MALHNGAHFFNIYVLWVAEQDRSVLNAVISLPGWTGIVATACMGLMYSSALKWYHLAVLPLTFSH